MHSAIVNRRVLQLDDEHAAKRFLRAFLKCKADCVGRQYDFDGQEPIDQAWYSSTQSRPWTFSDFAYAYISRDIELDGFLQDAKCMTASELEAAAEIPVMRVMMDECAIAAEDDDNSKVRALIGQVREMLDRWEEYLQYRKEWMADNPPQS